MTEYRIECTSGVGDAVVACRQGEEIEFVSRSLGSFMHSVYPSTEAARTFARGILALADEIDGGEAPKPAADTRPKVGDRLRVTEDNPRHAPVKTGDVITVTDVDYDDPRNREDYVRFTADGDGPEDYQWFVPLSAVEPAPEEPSVRGVKAGDKVRVLVDGAECASVSVGDVFTVSRVVGGEIVVDDDVNGGYWYFRRPESLEKVVDEPARERATATVKIGDTVNILRPEGCFDPEHVGSVGLLTEIDNTDCKYSVRLGGGEIVWAYEVAPAAPAVIDEPSKPSKPSRAALLDAAMDLMSGSDTYTAYDLIALADNLAGEK